MPVNVYNQSSIDAYGRFTKTINFKDIKSVADSEARGVNYLSRYSTPFMYATLKVKTEVAENLRAGTKISVVDNVNSPAVDAQLIINRQIMNYPGNYDEIYAGDKEWRMAEWQASVEERLKRLQENTENVELLVQIINENHTSSSEFHIYPRYAEVYTQTVAGTNVFILGHTTFGILGTQKLGNSGIDAETLYWRRQYINTYTENLVDTDFKAAATTATWDTSNHRIDYTAGQLAQSESIDYNNGTITRTAFYITKSSGTFLYHLTADGGSHWEVCSGNHTHYFTYTGNDLRWRITENASGTGRVTKVQLYNYH
jgi:hypothetical protein